MLREIWNRIKFLIKDESGLFGIDDLAIATLGAGIIGAGTAKKEREWQTEQAQKLWEQQMGLSYGQDVLGAEVGARRRALIEDIPEYTPYAYTPPDEAVYERMRQLGIEDITEVGRFAQQRQAEQLAGAGLGVSSIGLGAQQRMAQRTGRELGRFETQMAEKQAEDQLRYEKLMADEAKTAQAAATSKAELLAGYEAPTTDEVAKSYIAAGIEPPPGEYSKEVREAFRRKFGRHMYGAEAGAAPFQLEGPLEGIETSLRTGIEGALGRLPQIPGRPVFDESNWEELGLA